MDVSRETDSKVDGMQTDKLHTKQRRYRKRSFKQSRHLWVGKLDKKQTGCRNVNRNPNWRDTNRDCTQN